jgi:multicomponent Na+:H+ antiporter subunit E
MTIALRVAALVALWLLAWGDFTLANVLSGIAVATVLLVAFPLRQSPGGRRLPSLTGTVALGFYVARQLIASNIVMAREVLRRVPRTRPGVLAHRLTEPNEEVVTLMTSIIALSPGTMVVDVDDASTTVYVHFFRLDDVDAGRAVLRDLEQRVVNAIAPGTIVRPGDSAPEATS